MTERTKQRFEKLKTSTKLRLLAGIVVTLLVGLVVGVSINMLNILREFEYLENFPRYRFQLAGNANVRFMNIQQYLARMSVYAGFPAEIATQEQLRTNILAEINTVRAYFEYYEQVIEADPRFSHAARYAHITQLQDAINYFVLWETLVVHPAITANIGGNRARVVELYNWHTYFYNQLIEAFSAMQEDAFAAVSEGTEQVHNATVISIAIFVTLSMVVVFVCISFPVLIVRLEGEQFANKAKGVFLANMSHEIRTPISVVLGISEAQLQKTTLPPQVLESFEKIYNSASLLLGIVNDVLDFSRLIENKMVLLQEEYETENVIGYIASLHKDYLGEKDINFVLTVDADLPTTLYGDHLRIKQIVINILSNAFKYTLEGTVELSWKMQDGLQAICISDTGMGMSEEQIKNIYEEYTRFHENAGKVIQGTGLGMSIVQRLLQFMGGMIDIESKQNEGTRIKLYIPQKVISREVLGREKVEKLQRFETSSSRKQTELSIYPMPYGKVLVVDDIEENLYVACGLLGVYGLTVETCGSAKDAINKIKNGDVYDIVFMDFMMPEMNGTEAMQTLRKMGYARPIVVLTANALAGQDKQYIESGFDDFLSKPIVTKRLNDVLVKYIHDKHPKDVVEAAKKSHKNTNESTNDMLKKLRLDFARKRKNLFHEISTAVDNGDIATAHRLAHTLKGLAGLIQERELENAAQRAESVFAEGNIPSQKELAAIENAMKYVLESVAMSQNKEQKTPAISRSDAKVLLENLKPLLKQRKNKCLKFVDELNHIPEAAIIARQIEQMQFAAALVSLDTLLEIYDA